MVSKKPGHIEKFLKRADKAIEEGIKHADEILDDAIEFGGVAATEAKIKSKELRKRAINEGIELKREGLKKLTDGISSAKRIMDTTQSDLDMLEQLGRLRKAKVITEKEFQEKKKKILDRI